MMESATAILGSSEYAKLKALRINRPASTKIGFGHRSIDEALGGGLDAGRVSCLSGEVATVISSLCSNIIANHLLFNNTDIVVIHATDGFDVVRLHGTLRARIEKLRTEAVSGPGTESSPSIASLSEDDLIVKLDRVKVMHVFDFTGVVEALSEIRLAQIAPHNSHAQQATTVMVSEDEAEVDLLLDRTNSRQDASQQARNPANAPIRADDPGLVIFQGFDRIVGPLIKKDYVHGHAFITSLLRSLSHLSRSTQACVVLTNTASPPRLVSTNTGLKDYGEPSDNQPSFGRLTSHPSVFSTIQLIPLHQKLLDIHVDLHFMLSKLPRSNVDAQICYGSRTGQASLRYKWVHIIEVLLDKTGTRNGRWTAFDVTDQETLKPM